MKKIIKISQWDASEFTADNVATKTHWLVKGMNRALILADIGEFSISYVNGTTIKIITSSYGTFDVEHPSSDGVNSSTYILYVNSDDKEIFGCASDLVVADHNSKVSSGNYGNVIRGIRSPSSTNTTVKNIGGYLALKFKDGEIIGTAADRLEDCFNSSYPIPSWNSVGVVLGDRFESLAAPLTPVSFEYHKLPVYRKFGSIYTGYVEGETARFLGEYFNGIYVSTKYYVAPLKTEDNKQFVYNGYVFDVDDATDIETVTV